MNILGVYLKNIRSYVEETIVFPKTGITCIYGDVGSGKTSILMAISFALFGTQARGDNPIEAFSYPKPEDLLRVDANRGIVRLAFIHRDKIYLVERSVERVGGRVSDRGGFVKVYSFRDGELVRESTHRLSSEELKGRILEILGLTDMYHGIVKEKKPYLYTMVMYIPQLNVYEVLSLDAERRRKIVNASLGLEKYINIDRNVEELTKFINNNYVKTLEAREKTLLEQLKVFNRDELEKQHKLTKQELMEVQNELVKLGDKRRLVLDQIEALKSTEDFLMNQLASLKSVHEVKKSKLIEVEHKRRKLEELSSKLIGVNVERIDNVISEVESWINRVNEDLEKRRKMLDEVNARINEKENLKRELNGILRIRGEQVSLLEAKLCDVINLVNKGVCPTCGQEITKEHGEKLINEYKANIEELKKEIDSINTKLSTLEGEIKSLSNERNRLLMEIDELNKKLFTLNNEKNRLLNLKQTVSLMKQLEEDISRLLNEASGIEEIANKIEDIERELSEVKAKLRILEDERKRVEDDIARLIERKGVLEGRIKAIEEKIKLYEEINKKYNEVVREKTTYISYVEFLKEFRDFVKDVETYVKSKVTETFRQVFRNYFYRLIEGYEFIDVDIDNDLTPIIRVVGARGEYELTQPSGGQITALSLAYRLALNTLFRTLHDEFKDAALILDEPTIGFSVERVEKLRELIRRFSGENQVIIVTHDRNLLEIGDCRIKLQIDRSFGTVKTEVIYEECSCKDMDWGSYRNLVENMLNLRI